MTHQYAVIPGFRPLELDLYLPPDADGPVPVVLFLHGGGWLVGSRTALGPTYAGMTPTPFERVARAGIAVASADYRLSGEAIWPAQLDDVRAALRWLREHGPEHGLDADRIATWGESAGGHLAALLGLSEPVRAVAAWYPPSDLARVATDKGDDPNDPDSREARLLGGPVSALPDRAADASPICCVHPEAPPFLLLHGTEDRFVPVQQSIRFAAALPDVDLELVKDADHLWLGSPTAAEAALDRTIDFLRRHL